MAFSVVTIAQWHYRVVRDFHAHAFLGHSLDGVMVGIDWKASITANPAVI